MTIQQAAAALALSPKTLHTQIKLGRLKAEKHGRDYWITEGEVERYRRESLRR